MFDGIEIHVIESDVISYPASVLVLKYAQDLYGADRKVVTVAELDIKDMPAINRHSFFRAPVKVAADTLRLMQNSEMSSVIMSLTCEYVNS
ncbi:MAG: hypothetical protein JO115_21775 [Pseudonocardiales bacterium]|nr:hypothetical protein [Pseudonocardiales bacterium]